MTNDERFEILWTCHHRQIDENRAVSRRLDELRENNALLQKTAEYAMRCQDRADKMAFFLGITWSNMKGAHEFMEMHGLKNTEESQELMKRVDAALNELFYGKV